MKRAPFILWVVCGAFIIFWSIAGFINLRSRPGIPEGLTAGAGIEVVRVGPLEVETPRDLEFILSRKRIGEPVAVGLLKNGLEETVETRLVPYYSQAPFPVIFLVIGLFGFLIGLGVFWVRSGDPAARLFYWLSLAFASAVMVSGDVYGVHNRGLSLLPGVLFNLAYPLAPAILWRFTRTFSVSREKAWFYFFWAVPVGFSGLLNSGFLYSQLKPSIGAFRFSIRYFPVFRAYIALACIAAVVELVRAFRRSDSDEVRAQIKWVFLGTAAGLGPFILLYQIPQVIGGTALLSEDISSAFFFVIPVAMAIAILKFRLMHVNLVINRGLVYSLLTMLTVGIYLVSVEVLGHVFARTSSVRSDWISLGAAVVVAVLFQPGRKWIQLLVDRTFFRRTYDYRKAVLNFSTRAQKIMSPGDLVSDFVRAVSEALPLERIGVLVEEPVDGVQRPVLSDGLDETTAGALLSLPAPAAGSWAREEAVRASQGMDFSKRGLLKTLGLEIVTPLPFGPGPLTGWLTLGRKRSGLRFTRDDLELLETLAADLAAGLQKIRLQEEIVYERASREKADELNRLKTEFISSVSHELRTPMTSIQSLSELLRSGKVPDESRRERLLELMSGECGRLSRFIHNVLDFGKIEQEAKLYDLRTAPLQPLIREVVDLFRSGAAGEGPVLRAEMPEKPILLKADQDAVRQALLNLVDNAIKYSGGRREVTVRLVPANDSVEIQVEDRGIGIEPEDRERIFEAFFRSPRSAHHNPEGVGLGLKIVKHIMDAHGGRIGLRSEPGKGTTFSLIFPLRRPS
jgi:signal transduction histidine kinase